MRTMTQEIAELRALAVPELVARYRLTFGKLPRVKHAAWLWKRIAWRMQADRTGGLTTVAQRRLEELIVAIELPSASAQAQVPFPAAPPNARAELSPGTILVREWRGRELRVLVLERGFQFEEVVYRSLSAVAKVVTGAHWNGRAFFGLAAQRKAKAS